MGSWTAREPGTLVLITWPSNEADDAGDAKSYPPLAGLAAAVAVSSSLSTADKEPSARHMRKAQLTGCGHEVEHLERTTSRHTTRVTTGAAGNRNRIRGA